VQGVTAERCANIGRDKKLVKQKVLSTSQIVSWQPVAPFVHAGRLTGPPYLQEGTL
jgi:hypothetical protein